MTRIGPRRRLLQSSTLAGLAALALLAPACSRRPTTFSNAPVILISIDTLRADHLPAYGYQLVQTPAIDRFRSDSILYTDAVSQVPLTLPSHAVLLTGLLPYHDGVHDNSGYELPASIPTLAAFLKEHGYETGAAISSVVLARETGIARGFDFYDDAMEATTSGESTSEVRRSGFATERVAEGWIRGRARNPFFFFLHLYEPHAPYEPAPAFAAQYASRPYDGTIATADAVVGRFLDFLRAERVYDRALIILLSDHGESLGEHGESQHGIFLYRCTLHVPLIVKLPDRIAAGRTEDSPVALVDVFPTVAQLLDLAPPKSLDGKALPLGNGLPAPGRSIYSETYYPRNHFGWSDLSSLTDARFQYIHAPEDELYDYASDPSERKDLGRTEESRLRVMRRKLLALAHGFAPPGVSDPERARKLASLGYLSATSAPATGPLPDPKREIGVLADLGAAEAACEAGRIEPCIDGLRAVVRRAPAIADAWGYLAEELQRAGRYPEALDALTHLEALQPGSTAAPISFANVYLATGNIVKAEQSARQAVALSPTPEARETLAHVLVAKRDYAGARREADAVLAGRPALRFPHYILALCDRAEGNPSAALAELDRIVAETAGSALSPMANVQFERGDLLARAGRSAEAEKAFRAEIAAFPGNLRAWAQLAMLLASEGREDDAKQVVAQMVRSSPNPDATNAAATILAALGREKIQ